MWRGLHHRKAKPGSCEGGVLATKLQNSSKCVICMDAENAGEATGVTCAAGGHFVCRVCLQGLVTNITATQLRSHKGAISCPARGGHDGLQSCSFRYEYPHLLPYLDPDTQVAYVAKLQAMLATVLQGEEERKQQGAGVAEGGQGCSPANSASWARFGRREGGQRAGVDGASAEQRAEEALHTHRTFVIENILTLKCPRAGCHMAFIDFDGCFALTCHNCGCGFCAICMWDCGNNAHDHCKEVHGGYFGSMETWERVQRVKAVRALALYMLRSLASESEEARTRFLTHTLRKDLKDLGIEVKDVLEALDRFHGQEHLSDETLRDLHLATTRVPLHGNVDPDGPPLLPDNGEDVRLNNLPAVGHLWQLFILACCALVGYWSPSITYQLGHVSFFSVMVVHFVYTWVILSIAIDQLTRQFRFTLASTIGAVTTILLVLLTAWLLIIFSTMVINVCYFVVGTAWTIVRRAALTVLRVA